MVISLEEKWGTLQRLPLIFKIEKFKGFGLLRYSQEFGKSFEK
jgi:hypothetical protein